MGTTAQKLQAIVDSKAVTKTAAHNLIVQNQRLELPDKLSDWPDKINDYMSTITIDHVSSQYQYYMAFGAKGTSYNGNEFFYTKWMGNRIQEVKLFPNQTGAHTIDNLAYCFAYAWQGCANLKSVIFPSGGIRLNRSASNTFNSAFAGCSSLTDVSVKIVSFGNASSTFANAFHASGIVNFEIETPSTIEATQQNFVTAFQQCTHLKKITVKGLKDASQNGTFHYFGGGTYNWLYNCTSGVDEIEFTDLETVTNTNVNGTGVLSVTPQGQTSSNAPKTLKFPKLTSLAVMDGESTYYFSTFIGSLQTDSTSWCYVKDIYLPSCTYVGYNAFNMLNGTRVHFATTNQTAIEALPGYSRHFLTYGNCNILFDL